ncbi:hypothetical protein [Microbacterium sp. Marseille-Q6965]|uniref:hypothetical protein n=1 Tax=Microbacterium sp. Marseille-Q6965 TaxID=2965072 RepID=UPI0021B7F23E|nr:hypothetical protein [Microbacterium sp. Marseille-Q6965]
MITHPPTDTAVRIVAALRERGLPVAVGGSALLASLGLVDRVRDWDITCEGEPAVVTAALDRLGLAWTAPASAGRPFATRARLVVDAGDHEIDVLVGFAAWDGDRLVPFPVGVTGEWRGLPIADPAVWAIAYRLIGRPERAALLERWLAG